MADKTYTIEDGILTSFFLEDEESVEIPDGVTEISGSAFSENKTLKRVVIPSWVLRLGEGAFSACEALETVELTDRPFFVGVQYHPEFKSRPNKPHPLFVGFIEACLG